MYRRFIHASYLIATLTSITSAGSALAHDGHGMTGSHWHATDVLGFVAIGALVALAVWLSRRDK